MKTFLTLLFLILLQITPVLAAKPEAALNSVMVVGTVSAVHEQMIYNQLQSQLSEHYDLVPRAVFEKAMEKMKEELDADQCTEENCIRNLQDILQVERLFTLMILRDGAVTQLSLVLVTNERKIPKSGECIDCSISQLMQKIQSLTRAVVDNDLGAAASGSGFVSPISPSASGGPTSSRVEILQPKVNRHLASGVAALSFDSKPTGSTVYLGDTEAGVTPFYDDRLKANQRILITLKKDDYKEKQLQVSLKEGINDLGSIMLKPAFGSLLVTSEPTGADVYLAGRKVGITPYRTDKLSSNAYLLDVRKKWYFSERVRLVIRDEQSTEKHIKLRPNYGEFKVNTSPVGTVVRVLNKKNQKVANGISPTTIRLEPGNYSFFLEKTGYRPISGKLVIARNETREITSQQATLIKKEGQLIIGTEPFKKGAEIYIDGNKLEEAVPAQITLAEGKYKLSVNVGEYSGRMVVEVKDGQIVPVKVNLQKSGGLKGYPAGLFAVKQSFTDSGKGTVRDNNTGLIWQKKEDQIKRNWKEAIKYCQSLKIIGFSDWRLPSREELISLVDYSVITPAIDTKYFPNTNPTYYWTSTSCAHRTGYKWGVGFARGYVDCYRGGKKNYVRCVRGEN